MVPPDPVRLAASTPADPSCGRVFAFDPQRRAIMLVAGDKAGRWQKWYKVNIPIADEMFDRHLRRLEGK